ncbi:MAG: alkane 1-monooxygenase, partial [Thalassolituus oleivorans]|nr:alkane 1-monooxygenase [Thalassolituus oleivorans]
MFHYLKYFLFHLIGIAAASVLFLGEGWVIYGLIGLFSGYIILDAILGDDTSTPNFKHPGILTIQLWFALPILSVIVFAFIWQVSATDVLGAGAFIQSQTGIDVLANRAAGGVGVAVSAVIITGLMIGLIGTITAHELTHRTWDPVSMFIGRWL